MHIRRVIGRYGITSEVVIGPVGATDDDGWEHYASTVRLSYPDGPSFYLPWRAGLGHSPNDITTHEVLYAVISDAQSGALDFDDFCSEFDYDEDSRKAYATWEACQKMNRDLRSWARSQAMVDDLFSAEDD